MSVEILGYKGSPGLNDAQLEEYRTLARIFKDVGIDIMGIKLYEWYQQLAELRGDSGFFYCPYIPLMTFKAIK